MLRYVQPTPIFHLIAMLLYFGKYITKPYIGPSRAVLSIFLMYFGFHHYPSLVEFAFLPYYVISLYGLRNRDYYVFIGSILVAIHLYSLTPAQIIAHASMNFGRAIKIKPNAIDFFIVHAVMFVCFIDWKTTYVEILAGISAFLVYLFPDNIDIFSSSMMLNMHMLKALPLHLLELDWYLYFKNNHFKRVYNSFNFIVPLGVLAFAYVHALYSETDHN